MRRGFAWPLIDAEGQRQRICGKNQGAEAPAVVDGVVPKLLRATDPRPSCKAEATVELMTGRLAELVSARLSDACQLKVHCARRGA